MPTPMTQLDVRGSFGFLKTACGALLGGWAFSGALSAWMLALLSSRGIPAEDLHATLSTLTGFPWFEAALRLWCVALAAYLMARQGGELPWTRATLLGLLVGCAMLGEAWWLPLGSAARLPWLTLWATLPAAWGGVLLACPLADADFVAAKPLSE
ncbi:MAG: hypothetical protein QM811_04575 [Pirellulales bacterium]